MRPVVHGLKLDPETRCLHWHSARDVVAIKMKCCGQYYACKDCHDALADHPIARWPEREWDEKAILCGICCAEITIRCYLACEDSCASCGASFNPGCRLHRHYYFETDPG